MMVRTADEMRIAAAVAGMARPAELARQLATQIWAGGLEGAPLDLGLLFASAHFEDQIEEIASEVQEALQPRTLIGLTAEVVIGRDQEFEHQPAVVLWGARLPGVHVQPFHLAETDLQQLEGPELLREYLEVPAGAEPYFILLADPFTFSPTPSFLTLLARLQEAYPGRPAIGGLASAGEEPGQNRLIFDGQTLRHGLVGLALWGRLEISTVVSQGCRPIGRHMIITRADGNIIYELGGKPPLDVVKEILVAMTPQDRKLLQRGLLVGCAVDEYRKRFAQGDFVIRNPIGFDADSGAMAVNDFLRTGQTVQFQVRDSASADQSLRGLLSAECDGPARGALLFSCSGRGTRLFAQRHHDARAVHDVCGNIPVAGCFCAGEIGPVGQRNFVHGHTASIGIFRPLEPANDG